MFEVFATRIVRSIKGRFDFGSISSGNDDNTSHISFPLSPQPMYTIISLSAHLASCCCVTVFPLPKGPGIAAEPPLATGKNVSSTL